MGLGAPKPEAYFRLLEMLELCTHHLIMNATALQPATSLRLISPLAKLVSQGTIRPQCINAAMAAFQSLHAAVQKLLRGPLQCVTRGATGAHTLVHMVAAVWAAHSVVEGIWSSFVVHETGERVLEAEASQEQLLQRCARLLVDSALEQQLQELAPALHSLATASEVLVEQCLTAGAVLATVLMKNADLIMAVMQYYLQRRCNTAGERRRYLATRPRQLQAVATAIAMPGRRAAANMRISDGLLWPGSWVPNLGALLTSFLALFADPQRSLADAKERAALTPLAAGAVALLPFAELASRSAGCTSNVEGNTPGSMQLAVCGAQYLHSLARQMRSSQTAHAAGTRAALSSQGAAAALLCGTRWRGWVASPVATASAVLAEALPALAAMAETDEATRLPLAAAGGNLEWAPVAAALRRRLPRRMAARFLPYVETVTSGVVGRDCNVTAAMTTAYDEVAAMAALKLQVQCTK